MGCVTIGGATTSLLTLSSSSHRVLLLRANLLTTGTVLFPSTDTWNVYILGISPKGFSLTYVEFSCRIKLLFCGT